jgi:hypothetical protein
METQKTCSKCGQIKNVNDFYTSQRGKKCKKCVLEITNEYKRVKRLDPEHRKKEDTLTVDDINEMFENQKGLCYWFKIPLVPSNKPKHPQQPSLDRLDRNKGYTKDNVVLCCYSANIGRNENDLETWKEFLSQLFE